MINISKKLGKLLNSGIGNVGDIFCKQLDDYIVAYDKANNISHGSNFYKPSSIHACMRNLYYMRKCVSAREEMSQQSISICANGSWRHEILQDYVISLSNEGGGDIEWIDPIEYIESNNITDKYKTRVIQRNGNEVKLFNETYQLSFMCDGIINLRGKIYILEIKTCTGFIFSKLVDAKEDHKMQATCYSMSLGIDDVIFLYEDRGVLNHKGFHHKVTPAAKLEVANRIADCEEYVLHNELPAKEKDKCKYCKYKEYCRKDYNPEVKEEG